MNKLCLEKVTEYIEQNITSEFYKKKIERLNKVTLKSILQRKNPYLFKAKGCNSANELITAVLDATVSSGEETVFGNFLERIAIFVCELVYGGRKSSAQGIDLEFEKAKKKYLISIKSGPYWANSGQKEGLIKKFNTARKTLSSSGGAKGMEIVCIEGCCYGKDYQNLGTHLKLCGQSFWHLISGNERLYKDIIEPLGRWSKERNKEQKELYDKKLNLLTKEFLENFCTPEGLIDWDRLMEYNSGKCK